MVERKERKEGLTRFHFICPMDREVEARKLLRQIERVALDLNSLPQTVVFLDPDTGKETRIEGLGMIGVSPESSFERVLEILSKARIAGYSRPTQVITLKTEPQSYN